MNQLARPAVKAIPFIDLAAQRRRLGSRLDEAIAGVLGHCQFIQGPEVRELEAELARMSGSSHAISCASGTDALVLALMAMDIGPGDAVLCPAFTFCATAEAAALLGATPVFVDVEEATFNLDAASLARGVATARKLGLNPRVVIPVDLFGLPADYDRIHAVAAAEGLFVLADAAQSFGAIYKGRRVGSLGHASTTSFFPSKPLGCYGDGGAVFADDPVFAKTVVCVRVHGEGAHKYDNVRIGLTARLDTMQAAVLLQKISIFEEENAARDRIARRYNEALDDAVIVPRVPDGMTSVWAQYTIRLRPGAREDFAAALRAQGIPTAIYYPKPLHHQDAYRRFPQAEGGLPVSERLAQEVISLPMHPYLDEATQDYIVAAVRGAIRP